jgi:hypothetical protein
VSVPWTKNTVPADSSTPQPSAAANAADDTPSSTLFTRGRHERAGEVTLAAAALLCESGFGDAAQGVDPFVQAEGLADPAADQKGKKRGQKFVRRVAGGEDRQRVVRAEGKRDQANSRHLRFLDSDREPPAHEPPGERS